METWPLTMPVSPTAVHPSVAMASSGRAWRRVIMAQQTQTLPRCVFIRVRIHVRVSEYEWGV
jgi:hypothetical protein